MHKLKKFEKVSIKTTNIFGGAHCTGGEVNYSHTENSFGIGSIYKTRRVYTAHDGDSVSDDGIITYDNFRTEYGEWICN